jgi:NAD+ kinase
MGHRSPASGRPDSFDPGSVRCVGIMPALHKRRIRSAVGTVVEWLRERDIEVVAPADRVEKLSLPQLGVAREGLAETADLLLSMGGDGTFLAAARAAAPLGKPVLGINLGGFGFLAALPSGRPMLERLGEVMAGQVVVQQRMMLEATVTRRGEEAASFLALNDVVVGRGAFSRLFRLKTSISGEAISEFPGDGMIVSTGTGSTGYSLAAGGPVVDPEVRVIILTPICAHTLSARTLVVPADRVIEMVLPDPRGEEINLTADGQEGFRLSAGDRVRVREAPFSARVLTPTGTSFYAKLRGKLGWGRHR